MPIAPTRIFPLSDTAVTVEFGNEISEELNNAAIALAEALESRPFPGYIESIPAYASTTVLFDPVEVREGTGAKSPYKAMADFLAAAASDLTSRTLVPRRQITIPVEFSDAASIDLASLSDTVGLSSDEIISIFLSTTYKVYMLGFLPGFAYMGLVDERIAVPRHSIPRLSVPKGSVGIAGRQAGIYPGESPGGWQIIGRTHLELLDPAREDPCLLAPGDEVSFTRIS